MPRRKEPGQKHVNHQVTFPADLWRRLDATIPKGERSAFICAAIEEPLKVRELQRDVKELKGER
jgi:hypothetical protein